MLVKNRKSISLLLVVAMVFSMFTGFVPSTVVQAEETMVSPVINEKEVTFKYKGDGTETKVRVAGNFTSWADGAKDLVKGEDGIWALTLTLEPGNYQYKFIIGEDNWMLDPSNPNSANDNSIFTVVDKDAPLVSPVMNKKEVTFNYKGDGTETKVRVAGSFTDWQNGAKEMVKGENDIWTLTVTLEPGDYEYKFIVGEDGWQADPANAYEVNGNSAFTVAQGPIVVNDQVTFNYQGNGTETKVRVAGDFTEWATGAMDLTKGANGIWSLTVKLSPGPHQYKFIIGENDWIMDPLNGNESDGNSIVVADGAIVPLANAAIADSNNVVQVTLNTVVENIDYTTFAVYDGETKLDGTSAKGSKEDTVVITLDNPIDVTKNLIVKDTNNVYKDKEIIMRKVLDDYFYDQDDLGLTYAADSSMFKVWAPTAQEVALALYSGAEDTEPKEVKPMTKDSKTGVWSISVSGDLKNQYYLYKVSFANGTTNYAVDPYAKALSVNAEKTAIIDLQATIPQGWEDTKRPEMISPTDAILYELHVRDLSISEDSGNTYKGKFKAFTEEGTKGPQDVKTGIDHLAELGVTHVHLLPSYDFGSVNERKVDDPNSTEPKFNWGYDPVNFNTPEGSYSTNPMDPTSRVIEFKEAVQALHNNGMRVVMDVVYNHTYVPERDADGNLKQFAGQSPFDLVVPGYYYRTNDLGVYTNGSGCGNEVASERPMVRKYIKDSVKYWATEYGVDGFRFDLMGLLDVQTMTELTKELREEVDPNILIYGEPWTGGSTSLPAAFQNFKGTQKDRGYAVFNDNIRGAIKGGSDDASKGFATGATGKEADIVKGIMGAIDDFTNSPTEAINYVTAHDNLNLWDKVMKTQEKDASVNPHADVDKNNVFANETVKRSLLANGIVLTSQGVPFIHAGEEILRSKYGNHNSYKSPDEINKIRWELKADYTPVFDYYKGLIQLRKSHPAFRMDTKEAVQSNLQVFKQDDNIVAYTLKNYANNDSWKNIVVIFNGNDTAKEVTLPASADWKVVVDNTKAGVETIKTVSGNKVSVEGISMMVLYDEAEEGYAPVATSISVTPSEIAMEEGTTKNLTAIVKDQKGKVMLGQATQWTSSNVAVATVSNGKVTGIKNGEAMITVKSGNAEKTIKVIVADLVPTTVTISGNSSVFATYDIQLTAVVKDQFNQEMLGALVTWKSSNTAIATVNKEGKVTGIKDGDVVITVQAGNATATKDITVKKNVKRYVRVKYVRPDKDYDTWNLWVWNTGVKNDQMDFTEITEDGAIANIEIAPSTGSIGFLVRKGTDWATAKVPFDSDDHNVKIDADEIITKVTVVTGVAGFTQVPSVKGPVLKDGNITFYYRNEELYQNDAMDTLESVKVKIAGQEYAMEYVANDELYKYTLANVEAGTYEYSFLETKDGETKEVLDPKNKKDGKSVVKYEKPVITIEASVNPSAINYNQNAILNVGIKEDVKVSEIYADLSALGGKNKVNIDPTLRKQSIAVRDSVVAGTKEIPITVVDEYGNKTNSKATIEVKTRQAVGALDFDWDEARIYFMLTDRFNDGDSSNNDPNGENYDKNHQETYHGGDFKGIINKLDYLQDLGINTIWITPIVDNIDFNKGVDFGSNQYAYHGYWAKDFTKIDEHLGDLETFKELIDKAHDRGMKIMVDVVLNHAGYGMNGFEPTWNGLKNLPTEEERKVFDELLRPMKTVGDAVIGELDGLPDFITENPAVRQQIIQWQVDWLQKAKTSRGNTIDYFRVDTVKHVEDTTWKAFKNALTAADPNFKMIGEYWGASENNDGGYLNNGQMDSLLDFEFKNKAADFVNNKNIDGVETALQARDAMIDNTATLGQFLSSHDQNGFLSEYVGGNKGKLKAAAALQITSKGQPVIYYGEELGNSGKSDWQKDSEGNIIEFSQNRKDMPWVTGDYDLHDHYKKLLNIRKDYSKVFSKGSRTRLAGNNVFGYTVFERKYNDQSVIVAINAEDEEKTVATNVPFAVGTILKDLYNNKEYVVEDGKKVIFTLPDMKSGATVILAVKSTNQNGGNGSGSSNGGSNGGSTTPTTPTTPTENVKVKPQVTQDGKKVAKVEQKELEKAINEVKKEVVIEVENVNKEDALEVGVPVATVQKLQEKGFAIKVVAGNVTINVPTAAIDANLLKDAKEVKISKSALKEEEAKNLNAKIAEKDNALKAIGNVYTFEVAILNEKGESNKVKDFSAKVQVQISLNEEDISSIKDLRKAGVYYVKEDGTVEFKGGKFQGTNVVFETEHFSNYVVMEYNKTFSDIQTSWAKEYIELLAARHITSGVSADLFAPNNKVTRGEFATFLGRAFGIPEEANDNTFTDVENGKYYSGYVTAMKKLGLINGYSDNTFRPSQEISREEMITLIMRAYAYKTGKDIKTVAGFEKADFADMADVAGYAKDSIKAAKALKMVNGVGENKVNPKNNASREEISKMIIELLEKTGQL